jgi:hypothetical protein
MKFNLKHFLEIESILVARKTLDPLSDDRQLCPISGRSMFKQREGN